MFKTLLVPAFLLITIFGLRAETTVAGVILHAPSSWKSEAPSSSMRAAQWSIPPIKSHNDAGEVVLFYFGQGQGGDAASNVQRWLKTISTPTGARVEGEVKERQVSGMKVTEVVAYGTYASNTPMTGIPPVPKPDYGLVGVIIEGSQGNIFLRMTGPAALIKSQLTALRQSIDSAKVVKP